MTSKIKFTRKELNLVAKDRGIKNPQNMSTEELKNGSKEIAKIQNISKDFKKLFKYG